MIFAVFDPSPLTVCINRSFFTFIAYSDREREFTFAKNVSENNCFYNRAFLKFLGLLADPWPLAERPGLPGVRGPQFENRCN